MDAAVLTGAVAEYRLETARVGLEPGIDGWWDDDVCFLRPWGFGHLTLTERHLDTVHAWLLERLN